MAFVAAIRRTTEPVSQHPSSPTINQGLYGVTTWLVAGQLLTAITSGRSHPYYMQHITTINARHLAEALSL